MLPNSTNTIKNLLLFNSINHSTSIRTNLRINGIIAAEDMVEGMEEDTAVVIVQRKWKQTVPILLDTWK